MAQVVMNKKTLRRRKGLKKNQKNSKKFYGKDRANGRKGYLGKFVQLKEVDITKENTIGNSVMITDVKSLLVLLRDNHITGMSGNGFDTAKKIESFLASQSKRNVLIVNAVECEPGLLHDEWLVLNHMNEILAGIKKVKEILKVKDSVIATKCVIPPLEEETEVQLLKVPAKYPMGEEHQLIRQVLNLDLKKETIPAQNGILVLNVQTVYQINKLFNGTYDGGKYITLADIDHGDAVVSYVYEGDHIQDVLAKHFGQKAKEQGVAGSGIMDAYSITKDDVFHSKITFAAVGTPAIISNENSCKGCGGCTKQCPVDINVKEIVKRREKNWNADISGLGAERCLHCGTCTYYCRASKAVSAYVNES